MAVRALPFDDAEAASLSTVEQVEAHIDRLQEIAESHGADVVHAALDIGIALRRGRELFKGEHRKGFRQWANDRWGYKHSYVQTLMELADPLNVQRAGRLLQDDPDLTVRRLMGIIREETKDKTRAPGRTPHIPEASTPDDILIEVLDAGKPLSEDMRAFIGTGVDLVLTSWPYCLAENNAGYVDFDDYSDWLAAAQTWAQRLAAVLAPNGRAIVNLPLDVRKGHPKPRPIAFDGLQLLADAGLEYETAIVWEKASAGKQKSNTVKRGSVISPNAPAVSTGDELLLVVHKGEWNLGRPGEPTDLDAAALEWTNAHWTIAGASDRNYPHVMPRALAERCIQLFSFPGDLVADFHCGRGTVPCAALRLGRRFAGGDLNPFAVSLARRNVESASQEPGKPASAK
jgi:DNA modification methylase